MIERILDDNKRGAPQKRTQCQCKFGAKPFRPVGNIPLLLEVFMEFRGFSALIQRTGQSAIDFVRYATAGFTTSVLDGYRLRDHWLARPTP